VPLLGDIPILGYLFKYTTKEKDKTNLLIMLTPHIIKDHLDLEAIRSRKQREYEEFAGSMHALDGKRYMPRIDYQRKRGLVEEINRAVQDIADDDAARAKLREPTYVKPGLVEPSAALEAAPAEPRNNPSSTAVSAVEAVTSVAFRGMPPRASVGPE